MENIKNVVSIPKSLSEQARNLARKMKISSSRLLVLALEDYIRRQENRELLTQINAAYADGPDEAEQKIRRMHKRTHRRLAASEG